MNGKDIFLGLRYVDEAFIEEAEYGTFSSTAAKNASKHRSFRRPLLIAAVIALMLALVGCAVVYVMKMQDLKVGNTTQTQPVFATDGISVVGYQDVDYQVLTLAGLKGSSGYQAAQDWYDFKQAYDPDHAIQGSVWGNYSAFPAEYDSYNLYSQDMKDKLDEILETYALKPAGASLEFRTLKNMCAALGIQRIQTAENDITVTVDSGSCRENGNFSLNLDFVLPEDPEADMTDTWGVLRWNRKDCFSEDLFTIEDTDSWKEWNYTTTSGNEVLIIRSPDDWRGWILCDRAEAVMSLQLEARRDLGCNEDGKTWYEYLYLTDRQMEQIADAIDFGIQPRIATQADVANQPAPSNAVTQDGYTVELKSVETDGWIARITLGITAPEGTVISRNPKEGFADIPYLLGPTNGFDNFTPAVGNDVSGAGAWNPQEDNDGLDNTQDIVLTTLIKMADGSAPFGPGKVWNIHFEDLQAHYWDSEKSTSVEILLAEGEWTFEITFGEENGDFREIELLREPITAQAAAGMYPDGSDAVEDVEVTSVKLRRLSISIEHNGADYVDFLFMNGQRMYAVMKDGSRIDFSGWSNLGEASSPIDLDQVDYVLLADGTKLMAPEE